MSRTSIVTYDSDTGFEYDSDLIEFTGTRAQLKDQRPANATYYHNFEQEAAAWASGDSSFTLGGDAEISDSTLTLKDTGISYGYTPEIDGVTSKGTFLFRMRFPSSDAPSSSVTLFRSADTFETLNNRIQLNWDTARAIRLTLRDAVGATITFNTPFGTFIPVPNQLHEFSFNFDSVLGFWRLFIDGAAQGSEYSYTYSRDSSSVVTIGSTTAAPVQEFAYEDFLVYSSVQHTDTYTPFEEISSTIYTTTSPDIVSVSSTISDEVISFEADQSGTRFVGEFSGDRYYFVDSLPVLSTSNSESNTYAEYAAELPNADFGLGGEGKSIPILASDGFTQSYIVSKTLVYEFDFIPDEISTCEIYGKIIGMCGDPIEGAVITFSSDDFFHTNSLVAADCSTESEEDGTFVLPVVETETVGKVVDITIEYLDNKKKKKTEILGVTIPNKTSEEIGNLTQP